jgi:hypothetical protein
MTKYHGTTRSAYTQSWIVWGACLASSLALLGTSCGNRAAVSTTATPTVAPPQPSQGLLPQLSDKEILRRLDLKLETGGEFDVKEGNLSNEERRSVYQSFIQNRMEQRTFYKHIFIEMELMKELDPAELLPPLPFTLKKDPGSEQYYLDKPCKRTDQVQVNPWWDLSTTVSICADSYKPEVSSYKTEDGAVVWCTASFYPWNAAWVKSPCKCGRNLMNCAPSLEIQQKLTAGLEDEQNLTIQYVVNNKLPFGQILTLPSTTRSSYADFFYARSQFIETNKWTYPTPTADDETLRPRPPQFNAGILSTWAWMVQSDSYRETARQLWESYLCSPLASRNVTPAEIVKALHGNPTSGGSFRDSIRMELATANGCENCHKILENVSKTMTGFTLQQYGGQFVEARADQGTALFYLGSTTRARAEGPATLQWLGKTISEQPEFNSCVVKKVLKYVYDGFEYSPELEERLVANFTDRQDFSALFQGAVIGRYLGVLPESRRHRQ